MLSGGSDGMSTQLPAESNFQPWYTQRSPASSLRPKNIGARRCGQYALTSPTEPVVSRNATRSSPSRRTRTGGPSGSGTSSLISAGSQYRRNRLPIGVPGPTRVSSSLISGDSIAPSSLRRRAGRTGRRVEHFFVPAAEHLARRQAVAQPSEHRLLVGV